MEFATAECATCHVIRPMNEMREVKVKRITGKSYSSGTTRGNRNSRSSSYSGSGNFRNSSGNSNSTKNRSSTRTHMTVYREWVCVGCKAPKSDMSPTLRDGIIITVLGVLALAWCSANPSERTTDREGLEQPSTSAPESEIFSSKSDAEENVDPTGAAADEPVQSTEQNDTEVVSQPTTEPVEPEIIFKPGTGEDTLAVKEE